MSKTIILLASLLAAAASQAQLPGSDVGPVRPGQSRSGACLDRIGDQFGAALPIPRSGEQNEIDAMAAAGESENSQGSGAGKVQKTSDSASIAEIKRQVATAARQCTYGLSPETASKPELRPMLMLYVLSEQGDLAYRTVRRLASLHDGKREEAVELMEGIRLVAPLDLPSAEKLMVDLDKFGTTQAEWRMVSHGTLLENYDKPKQQAQRARHFNAAIEASKQLKTRDSKINWELSQIYYDYISSLFDRGDSIKAKALLKRGLAELGKDENAARQLNLLQNYGKDDPAQSGQGKGSR